MSRVNTEFTLTGSLGTNQISVVQAGSMTPQQEIVLVDTTTPFAVDILSWATNHAQGQIRIMPYINGVANTNSITDILPDGSATHGFTAGEIGTHGTNMFDVIEHDTVNNKYKFSAKSLYFAEGVKITIRNTASSTTFNVGARLVGRKLK